MRKDPFTTLWLIFYCWNVSECVWAKRKQLPVFIALPNEKKSHESIACNNHTYVLSECFAPPNVRRPNDGSNIDIFPVIFWSVAPAAPTQNDRHIETICPVWTGFSNPATVVSITPASQFNLVPENEAFFPRYCTAWAASSGDKTHVPGAAQVKIGFCPGALVSNATVSLKIPFVCAARIWHRWKWEDFRKPVIALHRKEIEIADIAIKPHRWRQNRAREMGFRKAFNRVAFLYFYESMGYWWKNRNVDRSWNVELILWSF